MSRELRRLLGLMVVMSLGLGLCGARPPSEGHEVSGSAGGGHHTMSPSCFSTPWRDETASFVAHGQYTYRSSGWTFAAEAGVAVARALEDSVPDGFSSSDQEPLEEGDTRATSSMALRGGYHGESFGFELGPSLYLGPLSDRPTLFISAMGWGGDPELLYVYAEAFAGPHTEGDPNLGVGLGHDSDRFRFTTGFGINGLRTHAAVPITPGLWVGAEFIATDRTNWDAFLTTSLRFGETP